MTEFFPISSSGHLVLARDLLRGGQEGLLMILVLHLGSLMAIFTFYRKNLYLTGRGFFQNSGKRGGAVRTLCLVLAASLPAGGGALFLSPWVRNAFQQPVYTLWGFFLTGIVLFLTFKPLRKQDLSSEEEVLDQEGSLSLTFFQAVGMGLAQAGALFPGMSRTGWTISTGIFLGVPRNVAVYFSFLMAIPAIGGAVVFEVLSTPKDPAPAWGAVGVAFLSSWFFSFWALKGLLHSVSKKFFPFFAFYLWLMAGVLWFKI